MFASQRKSIMVVTARFMLDNKTISFNALFSHQCGRHRRVHKLIRKLMQPSILPQNLKYLEEAYNEAFESGATLRNWEELEVDRQLQKMKDGTQRISRMYCVNLTCGII